MRTLKGKNAFVTGTSQGIGYSIAKGLIEEGCNICMHYFHSDKAILKLKKIAEENNQKAIILKADLTNEHNVKECIKSGADFLGIF